MDAGYSTASTPVSAPTSGGSDAPDSEGRFWELGRCRKAYLDYLFNKQPEILEQKESRRYYHGSHWTEKQIQELKKRKQPPVTFNRISRKINGVIGLIERLRQDPKAFARTPQHEEGADLATAVLRYVLDEEEWKSKSPEVALNGAIDGIGGVELVVEQGDQGDPEIGFDKVEPDSFFYDPRCFKADFSDARYMGVGKWMDLDAAIELFPEHADDLKQIGSYTSELSSNPDREKRWFTEVGSKRLIRLVEVWYRWKGQWCYTIFTGYSILMEGESYFKDNKNKTFCKYVMFSCNVDHDGDRYGFIRNMKSAQDEYNHRRSKALHQINSKRLIMTRGTVQDIETVRREYARPDGVVLVDSNDVTQSVKADDQSFDFAGQLKLMENAVSELENYGPNQALIGDQPNQSGRAIALLQQAGMAELGPYILAYRNWKLRLYRAIWNAVQTFWTSERWIRVTDDQASVQFMAINQQMKDPYGRPVIDQTGQPSVMNPLGVLDVDIIIDEGPDYVNAQQDMYETLSQLLPAVANTLTPPEVRSLVGALIDSSPLDARLKQQFRQASQEANKPNPMQQKAQMLELQGAEAKVEESKSKAVLNYAKAGESQMPEQGEAGPTTLDHMKTMAEIQDRQASARHKNAQAGKVAMETMLAPAQAHHNALMDQANLEQNAMDKAEDRRLAAQTKEPA